MASTHRFYDVPIFSWVHISDIHFGHGDAQQDVDLRLVTSVLHKDIIALCKSRSVTPDIIFATGDLGYSGNTRETDEYDRCTTFLQKLANALHVDSKRIFHVPGNHDVQRDIVSKDEKFREWFEELRNKALKIEVVNRESAKRDRLKDRFQNYKAFAMLIVV